MVRRDDFQHKKTASEEAVSTRLLTIYFLIKFSI